MTRFWALTRLSFRHIRAVSAHPPVSPTQMSHRLLTALILASLAASACGSNSRNDATDNGAEHRGGSLSKGTDSGGAGSASDTPAGGGKGPGSGADGSGGNPSASGGAANPAPHAQRAPLWGDPGWRLDETLYDPRFPDSLEWAKAGVEGGIPYPETLAIRATLSPGDDIQAAVTQVGQAGGGVIVLKAGVYTLATPIAHHAPQNDS